jgi:hypothetical protein
MKRVRWSQNNRSNLFEWDLAVEAVEGRRGTNLTGTLTYRVVVVVPEDSTDILSDRLVTGRASSQRSDDISAIRYESG